MAFEVPYYSVIFVSRLHNLDAAQQAHYDATSDRMAELARDEDGYLGDDSVRDSTRTGITVSYWKDLESIKRWKLNTEHTIARNQRKQFYEKYEVKIALVEREYSFSLPSP